MSGRQRIRARMLARGRPEIDVTAFLNLMVVLIPFLLLSAAFNQLSMFEIYLPADAEPASEPEERDDAPQLEVLLLGDRLIVSDANEGPLVAIPHLEDGAVDVPAMQGKLIEIKLSHPETTQITLLSEPQIDYQRIIRVMDGVRAILVHEDGVPSLRELFPDIALGPAPEVLP